MTLGTEVTWERIGAPPGGAVTGVTASPAFDHDQTWFAATMSGLFRSRDGGRQWNHVGAGFSRLALTAVAISPNFADDGLVFVASLDGGLIRVTDDGATWVAASVHEHHVDISALAISPAFARDGVVFAATMSDGVFMSRNRGSTWEPCRFGLLDLDVTALAISPSFAQDEMVFAATATGIFRSPNGGRAWREVGLPLDTPPVLCLAISPHFSADGIIFAGTDGGGLLYSHDRGASWHPCGGLALSDACVNAITVSPHFADDRTLLMATESAVFVSYDGAQSWMNCAEASGALCLGITPGFRAGEPVLVGLSQDGLLRSTVELVDWQLANDGLSARRLTSLTLSPAFQTDHLMVAAGAGEGVVWSADTGATWTDATEGLPSLQVTSAAIGVRTDGPHDVYAALPEGVWQLPACGSDWQQVFDRPARCLVVSPAFPLDETIIVGADDGSLWISGHEWHSWQPINVPWVAADILDLAVSPNFERDRRVFVAIRLPNEPSIEVWQGSVTGGWRPIIAYNSPHRCATIVMLAGDQESGSLYAAIGDQVYGPVQVADESQTARQWPSGLTLTPERPMIFDLAVLPGSQPGSVLAVTDAGLYLKSNSQSAWKRVDDQNGPRQIIAVAAVADIAVAGVYALEAGGTIWQMRLATSVP